MERDCIARTRAPLPRIHPEFGGFFYRHRVGRTRRTPMGVRIVLADKEPLGLALRRLKKLLEREGASWELRRRGCFIKPTHTRRAKRFRKRFKARLATLQAQQAGMQPAFSVSAATHAFWKKTGKP